MVVVPQDVYYDMFCLAFCPNGGWRENRGQARLSLKLCCLPKTVSRIKVKMELSCIETETYYSDICDFGYDSKNTGFCTLSHDDVHCRESTLCGTLCLRVQ